MKYGVVGALGGGVTGGLVGSEVGAYLVRRKKFDPKKVSEDYVKSHKKDYDRLDSLYNR